MSKFPHGGDALGAQPGHPLLAPVLRPAPVMSRQQALLDMQAIQRIPGLAGYWPADPAYLFEDSAGTIPASVGGVVGNVSNFVPATYGPNLVTNGTFDTDTSGWTTYSGTISQESGKLKLTNGATVPSESTLAYASITTEIGSIYFVTADESSSSANNAVALYAGTTVLGVYFSSCIGSYSGSGSPQQNLGLVFVATGTTTRISVGNRGIANAVGYLDNVVVRKVLTGAMALQTTTANKPYLRKTPTSNVYWLDSNTATSALTATLGNLGSACTVCQAGAEGVTFTEGVTISSTYNIAPAFGFNGDVAIFNRALTTTEKALLTRYMQRGVPMISSEWVGNWDNESGLVVGTQNYAGYEYTTTSRVANPSGIGFVAQANSNTGDSRKHYGITVIVPANKTVLFSAKQFLPTDGNDKAKIIDYADGSMDITVGTTKNAWLNSGNIIRFKASVWALGVGDNNPKIISIGSPALYLDDITVKEIL